MTKTSSEYEKWQTEKHELQKNDPQVLCALNICMHISMYLKTAIPYLASFKHLLVCKCGFGKAVSLTYF